MRTRVGVTSHSTAEQTDPAGLNATGRRNWTLEPAVVSEASGARSCGVSTKEGSQEEWKI